ncbi:MAG: chemotaxis protein CheA [Caulobacter sp.]|nr:chemotaxis protein CheA [Caulobacter sp.]
MDDLVSDFIAETREGLEALDSELVRFEQQPDDPETLSGIFRLMHTIKGTCGFLGLGRLQALAHAAESVLGAFRDGEAAVTPAAMSAILEAVDVIRGLVDGLAQSGSEPEGSDEPLIARLEALLTAEVAPSAKVEPGPTSGPAKSLIERLGGDATLDAAAEMAIVRLRQDPQVGPALLDHDVDALQTGLRDGLTRLARTRSGQESLEGFLDGAAPGLLTVVMRAVSVALGELDIDDETIADLTALAMPVERAAAQEAAAAPEGVAPPARVIDNPAARPAATAQGEGGAQTIRVSVDALEHLMTVVSELVLIRNQLIQTLRLVPESPFAAPLNRLNQVTSELQEGVMTTRMQPISGAWAKLPRLVRDLANDLGKRIDLVMAGQETELDRQVLELIKDPLTHMIRNAADHGLESPAERRAAGKSETGRISLQARHEGGAIVIEVADDGRGLSAEKIRAKAIAAGLLTAAQGEQASDADVRQLVFLPGFSTAAEVTNVSGRGVGMDVVRTNIEKIGGTIEVTSVEGNGARFIIRIPLTLTIVSALIVECCGERFAVPQSSVVELVSASGGSGRSVEYIEGAAVLRLRDRLLPLVSLQNLLQLEASEEASAEACIVVTRVGAFTFGVIVDRVFDIEEIVVKPVATVLRHLRLYSGATILGDGSVILILDPKGMSVEAGAGQVEGTAAEPGELAAAAGSTATSEALLIFRAGQDTLKAAPLVAVSRIEEIDAKQFERVDGRTVIQYRGRLMPVVDAAVEPAKAWENGSRRPLLVFTRDERAVGLLVDEIVDTVTCAVEGDLGSGGSATRGSLIIGGNATELIDVDYFWRKAFGGEAPPAPAIEATTAAPKTTRRLLVIDASPFSQLLLQPLLSQAGYEVVVAPDAESAMALYREGNRFHLIMADTQPGAPATQAFARTLAQASDWHGTPLLSLGLTPSLGREPTFDTTTLLATVSAALDAERSAA